MLLPNVYLRRPATVPGTRLLEATHNVVGARIVDPDNALRVWEVQGLYLPIDGRALGGVRAKLFDQKGFVTFCNQRDLEVLLGIGRVGEPVDWRDDEYVGPEDPEWFGFCCDDDDLMDDLYDRELFARQQLPNGLLLPGGEMDRRVHLSRSNDCEELLIVVQDIDPETGLFPDTRFETVERRWSRAERRRVRWERS